MCHCEAEPKQSLFGKAIIFLWAILVLVGGCGIKKPPVPWESVVPKRIVDLEAIPREEHLLLEWTSPKESTDKSPLIDLAKFQIFRSEGILIAGECRGCGEKIKMVHEMKLDGKEEIRGKKMSVFLEDHEARKVYVYQVVSINRRGYPSSPSNPVWVYWDYPPQSPGMAREERGDKRVDLYWEPVEGATGYNIYRRGEEEEFSLRPLNREPLTVTQYTDLNVENEKRYIYSVRAVRRVVKTDVEGKGSLGVPVTPTDLIPPSAPLGLVAIPLKNGIELNWRRNREPDLLGYYVYRRRPGEREFKKLNETPLEREVYLDTHVELEQDYEYAVTAVDNSVRKNESPLSEEVRVKYLY
jgi:fibronectin type 3 domain-containing protein